MKLSTIKWKHLKSFLLNNYLVAILLLIVFVVGLVIVLNFVQTEKEYIYARVKVTQGLWWASTQRPQIWYSSGLVKGLKELSPSGDTKVEIISVERYASSFQDQYESFLTVKMEVEKNPKLGTYTFNRSIVAISSPVEFNFTNIQVTGTVLAISKKPFIKKYIKKTVRLEKPYAYLWEFDQIEEGAEYNNGEDTVFTVISKAREQVYYSPLNLEEANPEVRDRITIDAEILVEEQNEFLIFGNEQIVQVGKQIVMMTSSFYFKDYVITEIF